LVNLGQNVLNRWKNFFNQVLNVHGVHDVRQMDIHTAEPLVPEPTLVKVEIAVGKLKVINPQVLIRCWLN
jgi:dihydroorotase